MPDEEVITPELQRIIAEMQERQRLLELLRAHRLYEEALARVMSRASRTIH